MNITSNVTRVPLMHLMAPALDGVLLTVNENDPVYATQEGYAHDALLGERRFQVLLMPGGSLNHLAAFWTDLGPASDFLMDEDGEKYLAPPYLQPVLLEHTVGECIYMAEHARMDDFAAKLLHTQVKESTLFEQYRRLIEEDMNLVKNRSSFGPYARVERNGYSRVAARQQQERLTATWLAI